MSSTAAMGENGLKNIFLALFLTCGPIGQFSSSLDQRCSPNTIDLRSRDKRQPTSTPLRSGQGHMSVGDSAEEFISIYALGRERLLCCPVVFRQVLSNICFLAVGRR